MIETAVVESLQELSSRRQAQGLSVAEVAQRLRFAPRQIEAIERGDWEALPGRAFARGALRSYGRLLGADVAPLLEQMGGGVDELRPASSLATPMPRVHTFPAVSSAGRPGLLWGLLGMGAVIGLIAFFAKDRDLAALPAWLRAAASENAGPSEVSTTASGSLRKDVATPVPAPVPPPVVVASPEAAGGTPAAVALPESVGATPAPLVALPGAVSDTPAPGAPAPSPATAADAPPAAAGTGPLRIVLAQDAWVEVRQADGRVVYSGLSRAGSDRSFEGAAPLSVTIGNAHTAKVEWKGAAVDLAPRIRGSVARLKLD